MYKYSSPHHNTKYFNISIPHFLLHIRGKASDRQLINFVAKRAIQPKVVSSDRNETTIGKTYDNLLASDGDETSKI